MVFDYLGKKKKNSTYGTAPKRRDLIILIRKKTHYSYILW